MWRLLLFYPTGFYINVGPMNSICFPMFLFSPLGSFPPHTCLWVFQVSDITADTIFCLIIIQAGLNPAPTIMGLIDYWKTSN